MARIAVVSPDLPYPPTGGGKIKSFHLLKRWCGNNDVSLISVLKGDDANHLEGIRDALPLQGLVTAEVDRGRGPKNLLKSMAARKTLNEFRTWSPELAEKALPLLDEADVIVADHLEAMQFVPPRHWPKTVFHTHNAEHMLWRRYGQVSKSPAVKVATAIESRRIAARERRYCNGVAAVLAAPGDRVAFEALGADPSQFFRTFHIGDDATAQLPDVQWADTEELVFFLGTLTWEANVDGLVWFLDEVWPQVSAAHPQAKFVIGGKNPPPQLVVRVDAQESVEAVGFVDDPETYLRRSRVIVAPLRFGSGMKLKVVEALMRGVPAVTTSVGVESIDADDGRHLEIADSPEANAAAVSRLLTDKDRWEAMRDAARELARGLYSWDVVAADAQSAIDRITRP